MRSEAGLERLHAAAAIKPEQLTPIDEQQLDQVLGIYSHLRTAMHAILDAVGLRGATSADEELLAALGRVRAAHGRFVDEPAELLPKPWRTWVLDEKGRVQRTRLELGCGSTHAMRCASGGCFARSGVATPTRPHS